MIDENEMIKLIDFGSALEIGIDKITLWGSLHTMAPEIYDD